LGREGILAQIGKRRARRAEAPDHPSLGWVERGAETQGPAPAAPIASIVDEEAHAVRPFGSVTRTARSVGVGTHPITSRDLTLESFTAGARAPYAVGSGGSMFYSRGLSATEEVLRFAPFFDRLPLMEESAIV